MRKRVLLALSLAALLAGCSSVQLDDVPVENRTGQAVVPGGGPGSGNPSQSRVATVVADEVAGTAMGPQNVARIVYFDYDSYVIKPEFQQLIEAHARFLKANGNRQVAVEGHTDDRGGREYNLALGQRRSEAVRRAFGLLGVPDARIEAVSFGKEKPAVPGMDEAAFAKNRRAEIAYR